MKYALTITLFSAHIIGVIFKDWLLAYFFLGGLIYLSGIELLINTIKKEGGR